MRSMNLSDRLEERLTGPRFSTLKAVSQLAARIDIGVYLVGGTVRDVLTCSPPVDVDVMACGDSSLLLKSVLEECDARVRKASAFATWTLEVGGVELDLSTARRETYARPGALPSVFPGTVEGDLARRDFSINAMAISLNDDSWGDLLDPHGGTGDLERGIVRVLHDRSFEDDATRILRAIRYACRLDFRLEERTAVLLGSGLHHLSAIGADRVRREFERIFREPRAGSMLDMADGLGVLAAIHPDLRANAASLRALESGPDDGVRRAALLLGSMVQSVPTSEEEAVIQRLNLDSNMARLVRDVSTVREMLPELEREGMTSSNVYRLLDGVQLQAVESFAFAEGNPTAAGWLRLYLDELRHVRPKLDGDDIKALGFSEGPAIGQLLTKLLDARLDGLVQSVEDEEDLVRRALSDDRS